MSLQVQVMVILFAEEQGTLIQATEEENLNGSIEGFWKCDMDIVWRS